MPILTPRLLSLLSSAERSALDRAKADRQSFGGDKISFDDTPPTKNEYTQKSLGELRIPSESLPPRYFHTDTISGRVRLDTELAMKQRHSEWESLIDGEFSAVPLSATRAQSSSTTTSSKKPTNTAGSQWFDMPAVEMTPEMERDIKLLKLRHVLDRKTFYKKDDSLLGGSKKGQQPRFFQIGTIEDSALDPYNRLTKKERKRTLVDELLADHDHRQYYKKKFHEVQDRVGTAQGKSYHAVKKRRLETYKSLAKNDRKKRK